MACKTCNDYQELHSDHIGGVETVVEWQIVLHNEVDNLIGKDQPTWSNSHPPDNEIEHGAKSDQRHH